MRKINYSTYQKKVKELNSKIENLEYFVRNRLYDYEEIKIDKLLGVFNPDLNDIYVGPPNLGYDFARLAMKVDRHSTISLKKSLKLSIYKHRNCAVKVVYLSENNNVVHATYRETENPCIV